MGPVGQLYLDTNIFILLAEGGDDIRRELVLDLIGAIGAGKRPFLCTSQFTLAELLVVPFREKNDHLIDLYERWIHPESSWLEVGPVDRDFLIHAALVRQQFAKVKMPDAIHICSAILFKDCTHLLTADRNFPARAAISMTRRGLTKNSKEIMVIEPTIKNLETIVAQIT